MTPAPAIEAGEIGYSYGRFQALQGVALQVAAGESVALLGPNGSGKSTLFGILSTLLPMQQGRLRILGLDPCSQRRDVRRRIGVAFQSPAVDRELTVEENLRFHAALYGLVGKNLRDRIIRAAEEFFIADRLRQRVGTLSGGLRRRVELAKVVLTDPELILLDEPSSGLDPSARLGLMEGLQRRQRKGCAVLLTTHLIDEAEKCDKVGIMCEGKLRDFAPPTQLIQLEGVRVLTLVTDKPDFALDKLRRSGLEPMMTGPMRMRVEVPPPPFDIAKLLQDCAIEAQSFSVARPTLEDAYFRITGRTLSKQGPAQT